MLFRELKVSGSRSGALKLEPLLHVCQAVFRVSSTDGPVTKAPWCEDRDPMGWGFEARPCSGLLPPTDQLVSQCGSPIGESQRDDCRSVGSAIYLYPAVSRSFACHSELDPYSRRASSWLPPRTATSRCTKPAATTATQPRTTDLIASEHSWARRCDHRLHRRRRGSATPLFAVEAGDVP